MGKFFKTLRGVSVGKMVWSVSSYSEIVNEFLSPENLFGSQKSGRFGVRLIVAWSSFMLAYNRVTQGIFTLTFSRNRA